MLTLWDLVTTPETTKRPQRARSSPPAQGVPTAVRRLHRTGEAADRYERMTREMLRRYTVRVRKWRSSMSGCAWQVYYADGSISNLIESPRPRGPVSAAIFLHEIGHHAIGLGRFKPRCFEEYCAWAYSIAQMREWRVNITPRVHDRVRLSLEYAVAKAARRGLRTLAEPLVEYLDSVEDVAQAERVLTKFGDRLAKV